MISLIYFLTTRVDLYFAVQNQVKFSSNPGKVQFAEFGKIVEIYWEQQELGIKI